MKDLNEDTEQKKKPDVSESNAERVVMWFIFALATVYLIISLIGIIPEHEQKMTLIKLQIEQARLSIKLHKLKCK